MLYGVGWPLTEEQVEGFLEESSVLNDETLRKIEEGIEIMIVKVDANDSDKPLEGAGFELRQFDPTSSAMNYKGEPVVAATTGKDNKTGADGKAVFDRVGSGYYAITETAVPDGYVLTNGGAIYIRVQGGKVSLVEKRDAGWVEVEHENDNMLSFNAATKTFTIGNEPGVALPSTGGPGTRIFTILGLLLTGLAGTVLVMWEKKKSNG